MKPTFDMRCDEAVRLLAAKDVPGWKTVPAFYRCVWSLGLNLRPPHFASWEANFFFFGARVGMGIACVYLALTWVTGNSELALIQAAAGGIGSGFAAGFAFAARYQRQAEEHQLPRWSEICASADVFD